MIESICSGRRAHNQHRLHGHECSAPESSTVVDRTRLAPQPLLATNQQGFEGHKLLRVSRLYLERVSDDSTASTAPHG